MNEGKGKIWFLRGGLFAKYVFALVGLVVFVLAINGAMETWIGYRGTKSSLTDAMHEKAEATAKRIEQSMAEMERQISWVTRASATARPHAGGRTAPRRLHPALEPGAVGQSALLHHPPGPRAIPAVAPCRQLRQQCRFLPRCPLHRDAGARHQLFAGVFPRPAALYLDRAVAFRLQRRRHGGRDRSSLSQRLSERRPGRPLGFCLCGRSARAGCWRVRPRAPTSAGNSRSCRRWRPCWPPAARR